MKRNIKVISKNKLITPNLVGKKVQVYNGKQFYEFSVNLSMVNFKIGQFCITKKKVVHKQKNKI